MEAVRIKKQNTQKNCVIKMKLKFENYKNFLETTKLENEINFLAKIKLTYIILKKSIKNL